jgi:hypothetical protein
MLSPCAKKALAALRGFDPEVHLNVPRLAAAIGSVEHDARDAVRELEYAGLVEVETRFPHNRRFVKVTAPAEPRHHVIKIRGDGPNFTVSGTVEIQSTKRPIQDAAAELIRLGTAAEDKLSVDGGPCSFVPSSLAAILAARKPPPAGRYIGDRAAMYNNH